MGLKKNYSFIKLNHRKKSPKYKGALQCFTTILREERIRGIYKGVTSPLAGIAFMNATIFTTYGKVLQHMDEKEPLSHWWAGCAAGVAQTAIISPVELIKTQMQIQGIGKSDTKNYRGWRGTCAHIYKHSGYRGFRTVADTRQSINAIKNGFGFGRGITLALVRDIPSFGAFFYTYELLVGESTNFLNFNGNTGFASKEELLETSKVIFAGGCAGVNSWIITYPVDVVKTQIQAQHLDRPENFKGRFPGLTCAREGLKTNGFRFFWIGIIPTCIRAFPSNGAVFLTWQTIRSLYSEKTS
ncbi:unnamed protein product [Oikopleura dioica]|uniref:Uncharacterized protein n=1 Tax=Oikopleura dioica TaxID=34765 RepID=E4WXW9_OIKDI|nr:unnamed protein product [Oikopleura dioica]